MEVGELCMPLIVELIPIALGGALGAISRYLLSIVSTLLFPHFPLATLGVNGLGSLFAGMLLGLAVLDAGPSPAIRLFLLTGFLGAFTTFSAFSFETLELWLEHQRGLAVLNVAANFVIAILAVTAGFWLVQRVHA